MKTLSNYIEASNTKSFDKAGAFFAFSTEQFNEAKKPNTKYVQMAHGLLCPKDKATQLSKELKENHKRALAQDIKENGITAIIKRELANHEAYYTGELEDTHDSLQSYNITYEQIQAVYNEQKQTPEVINSL